MTLYFEEDEHQELLVLTSENEGFHDLSTMCAMKSQCKALEHIRTAHWPLCGWKCLFCYIKMSEEGTHRVDFGTPVRSGGTKDPPGKVRFSVPKRGHDHQELLVLQ